MESNTKLSIHDIDILEIYRKVEVTCAAIYRCFSVLYVDKTLTSALWDKTSKEEENHAEQFGLACRLQGAGIQSLKTNLDQATKLLTKMQSVYDAIQTAPPTIEEAFRFALKMEHSLEKYHMNAISTFEDESIARLFSAMMKCDQNHIAMLEKAYEDLQV
jgi:bacterioferritin (cytochrome b1)